MTDRLFVDKDEQSLRSLVDNSRLLTIKKHQLDVIDRIVVPTNEYGIPQPHKLIENVLGTLAVRHIWTGYYDVHHVAWPEADYKKANIDYGNNLGGQYRGTAALKLRLPRQLHNYIHKITEPPPLPEVDVMCQWVKEKRQVERLYDTVRLKNLSEIELPEAKREKFRFSNFKQKLEDMEDGELGLMPERDYLASLDIKEARCVLRALARTRHFSNSRRRRRSIGKIASVQSAYSQ